MVLTQLVIAIFLSMDMFYVLYILLKVYITAYDNHITKYKRCNNHYKNYYTKCCCKKKQSDVDKGSDRLIEIDGIKFKQKDVFDKLESKGVRKSKIFGILGLSSDASSMDDKEKSIKPRDDAANDFFGQQKKIIDKRKSEFEFIMGKKSLLGIKGKNKKVDPNPKFGENK